VRLHEVDERALFVGALSGRCRTRGIRALFPHHWRRREGDADPPIENGAQSAASKA